MILKKIAFHEAAHTGESGAQGGTPDDVIELPAKVIEVYSKYVRQFLELKIRTEKIKQKA